MWSTPLRSDSLVPGVNDLGNRRPRIKGGKTREVCAAVPLEHPVVEHLDAHGSTTSTAFTSQLSSVSSVPTKRLVSLRDLCVEDKKRVANLIKELAKVGEEKENAEKNLQLEREHYEEQILKLVRQQEEILKEREEVHQKLSEYQTYIQKYGDRQEEKQKTRPTSVPVQLENHNNNADHLMTTYPPTDVKNEGDNIVDEQSSNDTEGPEELSSNLYINQMDRTEVREFSTQAHPPSSPRPFTAMIDKELANQRKLLASTMGPMGQTAEALSHDRKESQEGNTAYLSPEKSELITRFMKSQLDARNAMQQEEKSSNHSPREADRGDRKTKSKHRKPPPTYAPFHLPIMSSTQKSSEFGDAASRDTSHLSERLPQGQMSRQPDTDLHEGPGRLNARRDREKERGGKNRQKGMCGQPAKVEFSRKLESQDGPRGHFSTDIYHKMTAEERRAELLKQRITLLEEQRRLREVLLRQERKLKQRAPEPAEDLDKEVMEQEEENVKMLEEGSVAALEQELLKREEQLHKAREMLTQKKEQAMAPSVSSNGKSTYHRWEKNRAPETLKEEGDKFCDPEVLGSDGDGCALYSSPSGVVKTLDYSLHSDTETQASDKDGDKVITTSTHGRSSGSRVKDKVDVGTSISYGHMPLLGESTDSPQPAKKTTPGTVSGKKDRAQQGGRNERRTHQAGRNERISQPGKKATKKPMPVCHSPGDKTLAVLNIINSLPDPQVTPVVTKSKNRTRAYDIDRTSYRLHKSSHSSVPVVAAFQNSQSQHASVNKALLPLAHRDDRYHNQDEVDLNMGLFELRRSVEQVSNSIRQPRGKLATVTTLNVLDPAPDLDQQYSGMFDEDSNIDELIEEIENTSNEIEVDDYNGIVYNEESDDDDEDDYVNLVIQTFGHHLQTDSDDKDTVGEEGSIDHEESQILEDVFFVNVSLS